MSHSPLRIAVLLGGKSSEREVSKVSGAAVINAIRTNPRFSVRRFDPAEQFDEFIEALRKKEIDVVYIALHGTHAEDGEIQGLLQQFGVPYTGSPLHGTALTFDKISTKRILRAEGIPVADDITIEKGLSGTMVSLHTARQKKSLLCENLLQTVADWSKELSYPLFIKAAREGSSAGIIRVATQEELLEALPEMLQKYPRLLIETGLPGIECTAGVFHGKALPIIEISSNTHAFYNYESKYAPGGSTHFLPARISKEATEKIQTMAVQVGILCDLSGGYRVDTFVNGEDFAVLEVNTLPGMTGTSLLPEAVKASGIPFEALCEAMIDMAMKK